MPDTSACLNTCDAGKRRIGHRERGEIDRAFSADAGDPHPSIVEWLARHRVLRRADRLDQPGIAARRRHQPAQPHAIDAQRSALIHADAHRLAVARHAHLRDEGDQPAEPIARGEMRVGHDMRHARQMQEIADHRHRGAHRIAQRRFGLDASTVHRAIATPAKDREAGARTANRPAPRRKVVERRGNRRPFPEADIFAWSPPAMNTPSALASAAITRGSCEALRSSNTNVSTEATPPTLVNNSSPASPAPDARRTTICPCPAFAPNQRNAS
jgi:hypothetical protein